MNDGFSYHFIGGSSGAWIDAHVFCLPAAMDEITAARNNGCNEHFDESVHDGPPRKKRNGVSFGMKITPFLS